VLVLNFEAVMENILDRNKGILRLKPNFVARFYPAYGRLGIKEIYVPGRGWYSERWLASCVTVLGSSTEGLSRVDLNGDGIFFRNAIKALPERILGSVYAKLNNYSFGVLTKILDPGIPIPLHFHAKEVHAKRYWNSNPKEEAYYYLEHSLGPTPYIHLGFFSDVSEEEILNYLKQWKGDNILDLSPAYRCRVGEGFHVLAGVVHSPCTLLTLEVQEESDVGTIIQAEYQGGIIPKDQYLLNGPRNEEEVIEMIDWQINRDPEFHRKYRLKPEVVYLDSSVVEKWVISPKKVKKFSVLEVRIAPNTRVKQSRKGPFLLFTYKGKGSINGVKIEGGVPGIDEVFVTFEAMEDHIISNESNEWLVVYEIFGPHVY